MTTVFDTVVDSAGTPLVGVNVLIELVPGGTAASLDKSISFTRSMVTDAAGQWVADLIPNVSISPGTSYRVTYSIEGHENKIWLLFTVPSSGSNLWVGDMQSSGTYPSSVLYPGATIFPGG